MKRSLNPVESIFSDYRPEAGEPEKEAPQAIACTPQRPVSSHEEKSSSGWPSQRMFAILLLLMAVLCGYLAWPTEKIVASSEKTTRTRYITQSIEQMRIGDRALGRNPLRDQVDSTIEPDSSWKLVKLQLAKNSGQLLDVELLRPAEWVELEEVKVGSTIYLDLPEQGAVGNALVKSIDPAPPIRPGQGNVVTGRFIHQAANCIDLHVEGQANPIGCTDNHPFWSEDRKEFIPAGKLLDGERVLLYNGDTARITQKLPRPGPETVYNLEIWGEHVYSVGNDGALVHNSCSQSGNISIQFGRNLNQEYHTFRHIDDAGLSRLDVQSAVENNLRTMIHEIPKGKPFNQTITVNGTKIQYTAYKLPNGEINVGRIHPVP